jgi:glutamate-1-semialdehyde 2,1-aminomutase
MTADRAVKAVKCLVWDLDNTLWDGILLEDGEVTPRPQAVAALKELDSRGILHSIASRNDEAAAREKLAELGLLDYFLHPQIGWQEKTASLRNIAASLNIGIDALAFIDDQPFERDAVAFALPEVLCLDAAEAGALAGLPAFSPAFVTAESGHRRLMYRADADRTSAEEAYEGPQEAFLESLDMRFTITEATQDDLQRAEELTLRTNQLNTTGRGYSYDELDALRTSDRHLLLTAALEDRYGPYGTIGLAVVDKDDDAWTVRLLLMSCRVMSRGVGTIMINHIRRLAAQAGARLLADFVHTGRNRMMYASYRFNRFTEIRRDGDEVLFEADLSRIPPDPSYVRVHTRPSVASAVPRTPTHRSENRPMGQTSQAAAVMDNARLMEANRKVIAGGGSSNMRNLGIQTPLVLDRASGSHIWDVEGNELVDVNMGYGPHLLGYAEPDIMGAVAAQLSRGAVTGIPHRLDHQAGELITSIVPSIEQVRFANSGTEAITSALRLARFITGRTLVITFEGHYHGWSETVLRKAAITNDGQDTQETLPGAPGMIPEALAHTLQLPWNDPAALERAFAEHGDRVAAVILEPVCGNAGVVPPAPGFLTRVADLTRGSGALLVLDEVITGFRIDLRGAQGKYGIRPDLTILSKVLGGGFPVAAFGGSEDIMAPLARNEAFHAGVYAGNTAAISAVVATLGKLQAEPSLYDLLEEECAAFEKAVSAALAEAGRHARVVRVGSVMSAALLTDAPGPAAEFDALVGKIDFAAHRRLQLLCQEAGVYFHPNPLEPWFLSTAHTRADLDHVVDVISRSLSAL